ncbi:MAG: amidohydrolase family protein, partial [Micrococcaceae bacterium]|nr:amidohydrolase family protein [Micrococcaceae bacterium]
MRSDVSHSEVSVSSRPTANVIIHGARIFDGVELLDAECVVIADGTLVAMGAAEEILATRARPGIAILDADGALLTPGFIDAHVHTVFAGMERLGCDLSAAEGSHETLAVISAYAQEAPAEGEWIRGGGWTMSDFPGGAPLATDLDSIVSDKAVFLMNRDHHSAWVNSLALERAGITAAT